MMRHLVCDNKVFKKTDRRGTALIVSFLVMGVLIAISLAMSGLVYREVRATLGVIDSGRAYYAAESAIEEALYYLDVSLPGWDTDDDKNIGKVGSYSVFEYQVKNKCNSYPCYDSDEYFLNAETEDFKPPLAEFYDILELNENITIPLFTVSDGNVQPVKDFTVEFFTYFDPRRDLNLSDPSAVTGWDVLRWKVFGLKEVKGDYVTESIHDFTAVSAGQNQITGEDVLTNAKDPSWFGTINCSDKSLQDFRVTKNIICNNYTQPYNVTSQIEKENPLESPQTCTHMEARDYYVYDGDGRFIQKAPCYSIKTFLDEHTGPTALGLNYLSLTNMMNPAVLKDDIEDKRKASNIYFRVETFSDDTVREFAEIIADGYSGDSKQSLKVKIKRDSYMPVFNFSLYSTFE